MATFHAHPTLDVEITENDLLAIAIAVIENRRTPPNIHIIADDVWRKTLTEPMSLQAANYIRIKHLLGAPPAGVRYSVELPNGETEEHELTARKLIKGVERHLAEGAHVRIEDGRWLCEDMTEDDADCILQFALFDKIRFEEGEVK